MNGERDQTDGAVKERVETRKQEPTLYRVVLLNDDYTTMEFVIQVLETVFERSPFRKPIHRTATVAARMIGNAMSEGVTHPSLENAILYVKNDRMTGPAKHQATRAMSTLKDVIGSIATSA
jgi:hypothetical protein